MGDRARAIARLTTLVTLLGVGGCEHRGGVVMRLESPGKTYGIELTGHLVRPRVPVDEHYVRLNAWRGEVSLVQSMGIHFADWFDDDFQYAPAEWVQENIVRFAGRADRPSPPQAFIRIANRSTRSVACLKVLNKDLILLFDLAPASVVTVPTSHHWMDRRQTWMHVAGRWSGGAPLNAKGQNFLAAHQSRCCSYDVTISDSGVVLTQAEREEK